MLFIITTFLAGSLLLVAVAASKILVFDDFEGNNVGDDPEGWTVVHGAAGDLEVVNDIVKNGQRSLKVAHISNTNRTWIPFQTQSMIISAEFWLRVSQPGRTFTILLSDVEDRAQAGPYIGFGAAGAGTVGYFTEGPGWVVLGNFPDNQWKYVKVTADIDKGTFHLSVGDGPNGLPEVPQYMDTPFRVPKGGPLNRAIFLGWDNTGPAHVDDFLIYEGSDRPVDIIAVKRLNSSLVTSWGYLKSYR
jgi:hypothetical protein